MLFLGKKRKKTNIENVHSISRAIKQERDSGIISSEVNSILINQETANSTQDKVHGSAEIVCNSSHGNSDLHRPQSNATNRNACGVSGKDLKNSTTRSAFNSVSTCLTGCKFPKPSTLIKIKNDGIELAFRFLIEMNKPLIDRSNTSNLLISNNFIVNRVTKNASQSECRITKKSSNIEVFQNIEDVLCGFRRCYVEDFMMFSSGEECVLLVPKQDNLTMPSRIEKPKTMLKIGHSSLFFIYHCVNMSSTEHENVVRGMMWKDFKFGFKEGKHGSVF